MLGALLGDAWAFFLLLGPSPVGCITVPALAAAYFEPNVDNRVCVTAAMLPSRSTTEKCMVQAGARCSAPSARRPSASPISCRRSR
jgi:hypothetical protein